LIRAVISFLRSLLDRPRPIERIEIDEKLRLAEQKHQRRMEWEKMDP